ncbi:uncharacterized protein LOC123314723 [Coccinella septempunctata]|uniref:uncharacterized protein LOC123314723 n=1 Tax=Coccinella septempunctata TaxID=41139 RepID=UPI001D0846A7|nr:uncharacterized protein LOC123314723 [Coccinella septempunctata]
MPQQEILEDLKIFTDVIMKDEGISQYEYHVEGQTEKGLNYAGEIVFFSVTPKTGDKQYHFVMKTSRRSKKMREALGDGILDIRETHVYSKVFPALLQLLTESNSEYKLENVAKIYLINREYQHETMIMGDLRKEGYRLWNKRKPMNLEHIKTVLSNYGKYHASSMALRVRKPEVFKELTSDMENMFKHFLNDEEIRKLFREYVEDALNVLKESGLDDIFEKLKDLPVNVLEVLSKTVEVEDRVIITHGDCWINNMMFKYESSESLEPLGICFLDFQLSALGSPASDLSYYLYTSCDEDTITNQFDQLLQFYYDSLASTLRNLGLNPDEIFTYQKLRQHWKKYAVFGLIMASQVIKIQLTNQEEAPSFTDFGSGPDLSSFKIGDIEDNDTYKSRIIAVFENYSKTCL